MLLTQATVLSEDERAALCAPTWHCGSGPPRSPPAPGRHEVVARAVPADPSIPAGRLVRLLG